MKPVALVALVSTALALSACGGQRSSVSSRASAELVTEVGQVRAAAASGDIATASTRLDDLRRRVAVLQRQGAVSDVAVGRILLDADAVATNLHLVTTTTSSTTTLSTTTTTEPKKPPADAHHGKKGQGGGGD
jgi:hypothetical protein